ncbi:hypothetical protein MMPV_008074 [Pyropia vietnamensis]
MEAVREPKRRRVNDTGPLQVGVDIISSDGGVLPSAGGKRGSTARPVRASPRRVPTGRVTAIPASASGASGGASHAEPANDTAAAPATPRAYESIFSSNPNNGIRRCRAALSLHLSKRIARPSGAGDVHESTEEFRQTLVKFMVDRFSLSAGAAKAELDVLYQPVARKLKTARPLKLAAWLGKHRSNVHTLMSRLVVSAWATAAFFKKSPSDADSLLRGRGYLRSQRGRRGLVRAYMELMHFCGLASREFVLDGTDGELLGAMLSTLAWILAKVRSFLETVSLGSSIKASALHGGSTLAGRRVWFEELSFLDADVDGAASTWRRLFRVNKEDPRRAELASPPPRPAPHGQMLTFDLHADVPDEAVSDTEFAAVRALVRQTVAYNATQAVFGNPDYFGNSAADGASDGGEEGGAEGSELGEGEGCLSEAAYCHPLDAERDDERSRSATRKRGTPRSARRSRRISWERFDDD